MNEFAEELRWLAEITTTEEDSQLLREAADEIDRLKVELALAKGFEMQFRADRDRLRAALAAAERERDEARAALKGFAGMSLIVARLRDVS